MAATPPGTRRETLPARGADADGDECSGHRDGPARQGHEHIFMGVPRIALQAEEGIAGVLAEHRRGDRFDDLVSRAKRQQDEHGNP